MGQVYTRGYDGDGRGLRGWMGLDSILRSLIVATNNEFLRRYTDLVRARKGLAARSEDRGNKTSKFDEKFSLVNSTMDIAPLRILLVGSGGREHALAWKFSQADRLDKLFVVPGNGGTAQLPKVENVHHVKADDFPGLVSFAQESCINLVCIGPEVPLVEGIEAYFHAAGIRFFGPTKHAARIEGSKAFSKDFMARHNIPTARYKNFADYQKAKQHLDEVPYHVVLKASGLAAGKGVILPSSKDEAHVALRQIMLDKEFGPAGNEVVIEELLNGQELSFLSFSDGYTIKSLLPAQDHKRVFDNDQGPNTGGMGCYAPTPVANQKLIDEVHQTILQPTIDGMRADRIPFKGLLFTGIMVTKDGPKVLEYNARFGDPETQTLLPLMDGDLAEIMIACTDGYLDSVDVKCKPGNSVTVVATAAGYPGPYDRGDVITIDSHVLRSADNLIFHAGTSTSSASLQTSGGRVIATTSIAPSLDEALSGAYKTMSTIHWPGMHYRKDIAHRALSHRRVFPAQPKHGTNMTYASAGVSIENGNTFVERIKPLVVSTARPGASAELGGFGGSFSLWDADYKEPPTMVSGTDGVGTKLKIAQAIGKHDTIGIDLLAMCANDVAVMGAEVLWFLDTYSCHTLDVDVAVEVVKGVVAGCIEAGCTLIGGETAEMGDTYKPNEYDIVGTTTGAIARGNKALPDKEGMRSGDVLLGLASSGCHSNGFSLIQKIIAKADLTLWDKAPWDPNLTVGESLLTPTRIYVKPLFDAVQKNLVKGMAHITGGGLIENIPRTLPKDLAADLDAAKWELPKVFRWLKYAGGVQNEELARVFNMGLGMVLVIGQDQLQAAVDLLQSHGETVNIVGRLVERESEGCMIRGMEENWNGTANWTLDTN